MAARVLIVDDSHTARKALASMLEEAGLEVCGQAGSGQEGLTLFQQLQPDVVTMDVLMPGMDGLEATRAILQLGEARIVIVSAAGERDQEDLSFKALQAGALEMLPKPAGERSQDILEAGRRLAKRVADIAASQVHSKTSDSRLQPRAQAQPVQALGIAASTGGPPVVAELLAALKVPPPYSILLAQHIAPGFTPGFARWLGSISSLSIHIVENSVAARPGCIYLPADGHDLAWADGRVHAHLSLGGACPSGNRLLRSLADGLGPRAAGMVLTGMGRDGADGLFEIHRAGGQTAVQSPGSCVVDGMPSAARALGAAQQDLDPASLIDLLKKWAGPMPARQNPERSTS